MKPSLDSCPRLPSVQHFSLGIDSVLLGKIPTIYAVKNSKVSLQLLILEVCVDAEPTANKQVLGCYYFSVISIFFSSEESVYTNTMSHKSEHRLNTVGNAITTTGKCHGHSESKIHE